MVLKIWIWSWMELQRWIDYSISQHLNLWLTMFSNCLICSIKATKCNFLEGVQLKLPNQSVNIWRPGDGSAISPGDYIMLPHLTFLRFKPLKWECFLVSFSSGTLNWVSLGCRQNRTFEIFYKMLNTNTVSTKLLKSILGMTYLSISASELCV